MRKWVYIGDLLPRGPYRGDSAEAVADSLREEIAAAAKASKSKAEDVRQAVLDQIFSW